MVLGVSPFSLGLYSRYQVDTVSRFDFGSLKRAGQRTSVVVRGGTFHAHGNRFDSADQIVFLQTRNRPGQRLINTRTDVLTVLFALLKENRFASPMVST